MDNQNQPAPGKLAAFQGPAVSAPPAQGQPPPFQGPSAQPAKPAPRSGRVAFITSLVAAPLMLLLDGGIAGVWWLLMILFPDASADGPAVAALGVLALLGTVLAELLGFFFIGMYAAARAGKVSTGVLTTLWTNLWLLIVGTIPFSIWSYRGWQQTEQNYQAWLRSSSPAFVPPGAAPDSLTAYLLGGLVVLCVLILISLILGAGGSALGGLVGRATQRRRAARVPAQYVVVALPPQQQMPRQN